MEMRGFLLWSLASPEKPMEQFIEFFRASTGLLLARRHTRAWLHERHQWHNLIAESISDERRPQYQQFIEEKHDGEANDL